MIKANPSEGQANPQPGEIHSPTIQSDIEIEKEVFGEDRRKAILEGLRFMVFGVVASLIAWCRLGPIVWFCRETESCQIVKATPVWPFYVVFSVLSLVIVIGGFIRFALSFWSDQAIVDGEYVWPKWLLLACLLCSPASIIFLFAALYRWDGISDGTASPIHDLGTCIYFSVITITTVGFGDLHPLAEGLSRTITSIEALSGYLILGLLVGSLGSMFRRE